MQAFRNNIFTRIVTIILLLLIPIVIMYTYSNRVAVGVLKDKIETTQYNQFQFFLDQLSAQIDAVAKSAVILSRDQSIAQLKYVQMFDDGEAILAKELVSSKLLLQSATIGWINKLAVYAPPSQSAVSIPIGASGQVLAYDAERLSKEVGAGWHYSELEDGVKEFTWYTVDPVHAYDDLTRASIIVEVGITSDTLVQFLDSYQHTGQGIPFLYHPQYGIIASRDVEMTMAQGIVHKIDHSQQGQSDKNTIFYQQDYLVMTMESDWMGWTLVEYIPLKQILKPIEDTNRWFYASIGLLLVLSVAAAFLLYRHVRIPLKALIRGLQQLKRGDFSTRIHMRPKNEFRFVMERFNDMVGQIEKLIETVYMEQLRSRDAELKQLQSQINPHFLYNCLHYIKNMTILGDDKAVIAMTVNLGSYFRYATRLENPMAPLRSEVELLQNYLTIQKLRMKRIDFSIDIPESMLDTEVPRLILQPIVENCIVYGLEPRMQDGLVRISGEIKDGMHRVIVEDNGEGMPAEQLSVLQASLDQPIQKEMGFGMWNVHQRLVYQYGEGSGLRLYPSAMGGLKVVLEFKVT